MDPVSPPVPAHAPGAARDSALGAFGVAVVLFWMTVVAYAVHPALPYNPVHLPFADQLRSLVLAPQGWAFFTRDPREEKQLIYGRGPDGAWWSMMLAPHARMSNALGLDRRSRAQGVEMALLISVAPQDGWRDCEGTVEACLRRLPPGAAARNPSPHPTLCGSLAIVLQKPVPWAWVDSRRPVSMPSRMLPLEVAC
jgi:antimicrobial peptide system SdpA family protein